LFPCNFICNGPQKIEVPFLRKIYSKVKSALRSQPKLPVVYNVNSAGGSRSPKCALLVYLVKPFLLEENHPIFLTHQNLKQCKQIAAILDELNYVVDAIDRRSFGLLKKRDYDLIISDRADLTAIDSSFKANAIKIFLASSMNYALHNANLLQRHELLFGRRHSHLQIRRVYPETTTYLAQSNAVVGFGNEFIMRTWKFGGPIYPFNNYGFDKTRFALDKKNFVVARKHFLFFASSSQVQKGLDILLEIFARHPELHLYICSQFESEHDFCALYRKELYETRNIHPIGWVTVNSAQYNELVEKCACVVHPTCSEGQPGSVVQCMHSGLIPLVTKWAGIDTKDFGVTFADDGLEEIENGIVTTSQRPEEWHRQRSIRTRQVAEADYSESAFVRRWKHILPEILRSGKG
jgi:glycosyltransferase involved in cell wall biosynthesis